MIRCSAVMSGMQAELYARGALKLAPAEAAAASQAD